MMSASATKGSRN